MSMTFLSIVAGLVLLVFGGDRLVTAAVSLASRLRVPSARKAGSAASSPNGANSSE